MGHTKEPVLQAERIAVRSRSRSRGEGEGEGAGWGGGWARCAVGCARAAPPLYWLALPDPPFVLRVPRDFWGWERGRWKAESSKRKDDERRSSKNEWSLLGWARVSFSLGKANKRPSPAHPQCSYAGLSVRSIRFDSIQSNDRGAPKPTNPIRPIDFVFGALVQSIDIRFLIESTHLLDLWARTRHRLATGFGVFARFCERDPDVMCTHPNAFLVSDWLICVFVTSNGSDGVRARLLCRFLFRRLCPRGALTPGRLGGRRWPSHALQHVAKRKRPSVGPDAARPTHNDGVSDQVTNTALGRGKRRARGAKGSGNKQQQRRGPMACRIRSSPIQDLRVDRPLFMGKGREFGPSNHSILDGLPRRPPPLAAGPFSSKPSRRRPCGREQWRESGERARLSLRCCFVIEAGRAALVSSCRLAAAINPDRATDHSYPLPHIESSISIHPSRRTPPIHETAAAAAAARASGYRVRATKEGNAWPGLGSSGHSHGSSSERRRRGGGFELKGSGLRAS